MRNRFNVDSDEKRRIISLHENSLKKNYLNLIVEQEQYYKGTDGKVGMLQGPQILPAGATAITKQEYDTAMATQKATNNEVKPEVKTAGNQEWLTYGNDKNYQYKKVGNDWITKNVKTNKEYNLTQLSTQPKFAGYKKSIEKLESTFPGGKAPTSTPSGGSVDTNQQSTVKNETLPGAPVYYPWIQDGKVSFDKLKQTLKSDPNLQNWYSNLTKLNLEQIKKVEKDFLSNGFPQSSTPQFPFEGSTSPTLVVRSIIQDATKIIEKNSQQG